MLLRKWASKPITMRTLLPIAALILTLASCAPVLKPFTEQQRQENNWTGEDLQKIQFYLSYPIVLQRKLSGSSSEITSGKIRVVDGQKIEEVVIPARTPGILIFDPIDNRLGISFEEGDKRYLMFGPVSSKGNRYYLLASDWKNGVGKVSYEDKTWYTTPESGKAFLMVDLKKIYQREKEQRRAPGRTIQE